MGPTLVILAAGMASRYGSMKQTEAFGPGGETIMDYSIYDAIRSDFKKIVFIIRRKYSDEFRRIFDERLKDRVEVEYVYQELDLFTEGVPIPPEREKPWGTAHAVLCAIEKVSEPFAVINADDFYGRDSFEKANNFLQSECMADRYGIIGYELLNTLSAHGTVNRGVCELDEEGNLAGITERLNISQKDGKIICDDGRQPAVFPEKTKASMNFWCFDCSVFEYIQKLFREFLTENISNPKAEFYIPMVADHFIKSGGTIKVISTTAQWFGVTYKQDAPDVQGKLSKLIAEKIYPEKLWS